MEVKRMGGEVDNGGPSESTAAETGVVRIYIGGLGGAVTADDLKKTFSAPYLGTVLAVDAIRSKGRSFAYLDFLPSSDKGLAKLFSTYNGCMWKGGRLRLEKAKEHYLLRLKREWEEEAELAGDSCSPSVDAVESISSQDKRKKLSDLDKMQLRIFFPKLRKVKLVPFKGTGKHKYSFQRVEAPPLPIHFCDCEQHSGALDVAKHQEYSNLPNSAREESFKDHEMESGGVNEEELNMMNAVMNKLFERENCSTATNSKVGFSVETDNIFNSVDDSLVTQYKEDQASDEDNLVINLVGGSNNNLCSFDNLYAKDNQDLDFQVLQNPEDKPANEMHGSQKRMTVHSTKKHTPLNKRKDDDTRIVSDIRGRKSRKILHSNKKKNKPLDEGGGNDIVSDIPEREWESDIHLNSFVTQAKVQQTNTESKTLQSSGETTWSQKSAWKNLVHGADRTTFHIADIVPSASNGVEMQPESDRLGEPHFTEKETRKNDSLQAKEAKVSAEASSSIANVAAEKATKGASWVQKSSWTQLVGDSNRSSFSITQILPNVTFEKHEVQQTIGIDFSSSKNRKRQKVSECQDGTRTNVVRAHHNPTMNPLANKEGNDDGEQSTDNIDIQIDRRNNGASPSSFGKKQPSAPKPGDTDTDETFTFMRSAASMKEWMKSKAALSGSSRKKDNQKK